MLRIEQTHAKTGIESTPSRLEIETQNATLELKQKHAKINIRTELPKVLIDQYECFAEAGLKNTADFTREMAQRGYQQVMEFIAKTAADGDRLAAIERGGNPIADICERDAVPEHEFGLDTIPKSRPRIDVKGELTLDPERNSEGVNNGVEGSYTPGRVDISFTPARVSIYMRQYNSIRFSYAASNIDASI
ncbi:MAG: DUF6470 family protein [Clostridia bacterium]|nr:DUF6470 family protein [Clostridia bacterium]